MRPTNLSFGTAGIRFRPPFESASAAGEDGGSIIVHVEDSEGNVGLGEGRPGRGRAKETMETALAFLHRRRHALASLNDPQDLANWIMRHADEIDANPSAFCAAELALLDLFARQAGQTVETVFVAPPLAGPLTVSAVYDAGSFLKFRSQASAFQRKGLTEAKLKLRGDAASDARRAALLAKRGRLRLDAGNLWADADAAVSYLKPLAKYAWAVEEPVGRFDWAAMKAVNDRLGLAVIVDASFTHQGDLERMPAGVAFIPNFQVSKLGGLMRSVSALRMALDHGRRIIVGAEPGETSILARAGLLLATGAGEKLAAYEGGYGTHVLRQDIVDPSLTFGDGGKLRPAAGLLQRPGLGLQLRADAKALMRPAVSEDYWMPLTHSA
jgi:L-alanine-DL-glutamate epimerase-like enolase superfamily enzyme